MMPKKLPDVKKFLLF